MDQNNRVRAERLPGAGADGLRTSSDWDRLAKPVGELWAGESRGTGHSIERNGPGFLSLVLGRSMSGGGDWKGKGLMDLPGKERRKWFGYAE